MNPPDRIFAIAAGRLAAARILGGMAALTLLSGCLSDPIANTRVDPASPIAGEVAKLSTQDKDYPSFYEIPPKPTDVRPPRIYGDRARAIVLAGDQLAAATAPDTWTLSNTADFQAGVRSAAGPDLPPANADTEAFVREARKRATPPPPRQ
jgi:hypothetical protein